ncbi:MAG: DUF167 domain-containing protein [Candidatus Aenigmatarchaeota archaeon]
MKYEVEVKLHKDFITVDKNKIIVGLTSRPEKGKANTELIKKIAKHFKISANQIKIVSGLKSRRKIVEI